MKSVRELLGVTACISQHREYQQRQVLLRILLLMKYVAVERLRNNKELHSLCSSPRIVTPTKSRKPRITEHASVCGLIVVYLTTLSQDVRIHSIE
jgi:hypothetical protein